MAHIEIDSFVSKFKHLWNLGLDANLNIESKAGKAFIQLKVGLGCPPPPQHHPQQQFQPHRHVGPARHRRRERREVARAQQQHETVLNTVQEAAATVEVVAADREAEEAFNDQIDIHQTEAVEATTGKPATESKSEVNDEVCTDEEYFEHDGTTAFICAQCKMTFFPMSYMFGNDILTSMNVGSTLE